jgi:hypothetical protein
MGEENEALKMERVRTTSLVRIADSLEEMLGLMKSWDKGDSSMAVWTYGDPR